MTVTAVTNERIRVRWMGLSGLSCKRFTPMRLTGMGFELATAMKAHSISCPHKEER